MAYLINFLNVYLNLNRLFNNCDLNKSNDIEYARRFFKKKAVRCSSRLESISFFRLGLFLFFMYLFLKRHFAILFAVLTLANSASKWGTNFTALILIDLFFQGGKAS